MKDFTPDDLWTPYKNLSKIVEAHLTGNAADGLSDLELVLRKTKQNFINLLRNSPNNAKSREEIQQGITEGINLPGLGHTILSKDLVDESIIISDMFNLNEFMTLELLCTAQQQVPHHPGLPRGLVAILLYYDGRKTLVATLKQLFQACQGHAWCCDAPFEVTNLVTEYCNSLVADGILLKIIDLLTQLDLTSELDKLSQNRALGPPKHRRQVLTLFEDIRLQLATCLFSWSAQHGLPKDVTLKLITLLSTYKSLEPRGGIDNVTLALLMALLYAFDVSALQKRDDTDDSLLQLPIVRDRTFADEINDSLANAWETDEMRSVAMFAFGLSMATLKQAPLVFQNNAARIIDQDEYLVECAIQKNVFKFIHGNLLANETIYKTEFYFRRLHNLITDFIELMHSRVTDLRTRADETARTIELHAQQGLDPPNNLCRNFETLLRIVGKLYSGDQLGLHLDLEYWGPMEVPGNYHHYSTQRSVSLFKFIRLAGELLRPILFIPYLNMLAGLSSCQESARNAFNLLKQGSSVNNRATLSWEHFFGSISVYYSNLRQEQHPAQDTVYRNRVLNRNINPQEIEGLQAVLGVIRAVAIHDEVARIALCEHPSWNPLQILLGLVSCSIVIPLKTELLLTLAALGKSKETALQLWVNLEASQIISTIPTTNAFSTVSSGIESEIEKTECRNETYPLSQAVLEFLHTLSTTVLPRNLGAGPRRAGIYPYFQFVLESIFLKFNNRNYKDTAERWTVAEKCLKIVEHFIRIYEVNPSDFAFNAQSKEEYPPPGFYVMLQMNTTAKSGLLRLMLHIIDESSVAFDTYTPFPGKAKLETCILYCLNIIEKSISQQDLFFDAHFAANCSIPLSGIKKALLDVNPRSGKADHMLNIAKYVTYNSWLPRQALIAVKILTYVARQPRIHEQLLGEFTRTTTLSNEIRHGFVECLESDVSLINASEVAGGNEIELIDDGQTVELTIKEAIIKLLEECLPQSSPNLAHYLLGFDINNVRGTTLQQPGVLDFPSNCMKSLVSILDERLDLAKPRTNVQQRLLQNAYQLLYVLCSNERTSDVVLRFLRNCNDFLARHISALPFPEAQNPYVLNQMTGLLKCVAIELKVIAASGQVKRFGDLANILLDIVQPDAPTAAAGNPFLSNGHNATLLTSDGTTTRETADSPGLLISKLLKCLDFEVKSLERPKWDFFDNTIMDQLFQTCAIQNGLSQSQGPKLINIKKLHDILKDELNIVQNSIASGQRQLILQETDSVLKYAIEMNSRKNICASTIRFMEAWGQVTETLFTVCPSFAMSHEKKGGFIIEILHTLLNKVVPSDIMPELAKQASSTLLQMLVNLRFWYRHSSTANDNENGDPSASNHSLLTANHSVDPRLLLGPKTNSLNLKFILKNIVEWIIISSVSSQKLKINLYASLLNFMHIIKGMNKTDQHDFNEIPGENYVSRLDKSIAFSTSDRPSGAVPSSTQMAIEVFHAAGDKIIDILCHDCTGGHDVCKMLALSCIDMLLDVDSMINFIQFISRRGYLAHLVDSLVKADNELCRILETMPENMKALYVYESKMAMLGRVASSHIGAELLLEHRVLGILSGMKVYDLHPDFQANQHSVLQQSSSFVPPVDARYQQILFPALNLCDVILSTLGPENQSAITQIIHFLLSHGDMIEIVLRAGTPFLNVGLLQELSAITGLIARTANQDISNFIEPNANQDLGAHLFRLQKLMLSLFPRFILSEGTFKQIQKVDAQHQHAFATTHNTDAMQKSEHIRYFLQISCNLALYARNAIANHSADHRATGVIFSPNINENLRRNEIRSGSLETAPSLGIVVSQLRSSVEYYSRESHAYDGLLRQRSSIHSGVNISTQDKSRYEDLQNKLTYKQQELKYSIFIAENCLYLLWAHLDFFMLRSIPINAMHTNDILARDATLTAIDAGWRVTADEVGVLKKNLITVFNETFCEQLIATTQDQSLTDKSFVEALLRRIKRLLQFVPVK